MGYIASRDVFAEFIAAVRDKYRIIAPISTPKGDLAKLLG